MLIRTLTVPLALACPECGLKSGHIIKAPAIVNVKRDWNEKANEYQRDPYTQAKAQLTNINREAAEVGEDTFKVTEESIQVAAAGIAKEKAHGN